MAITSDIQVTGAQGRSAAGEEKVVSDLVVIGDCRPYQDILTPAALAFVETLVKKFANRRDTLLDMRRDAQNRIDYGDLPDFAADTADIRSGDWQVADAPAVIADRRVEITAPAERKKSILALNSSAKVYMADFEDSLSPTWHNLLSGQQAMADAVRGESTMKDEARGKSYALDPEHRCVLFVRPRGWHLPEKNILYNGAPVPGALVDFGLFFFHNARELARRERGPFFYLPKVEHWREAELWDDVMTYAEQALDLPRNTAKATLLIETLPAVFQMHEILHAMKERLVGLNCGRWDYIFSYIKTLRLHGAHVLPERNLVTMKQPLMKAYSLELIKTCHRRNAHAMGGMSAFIPVREDQQANEAALEKVRDDKRHEVQNGHDGTWVAHPDLIEVASAIFDEHMPSDNHKHKIPDVAHTANDFLLVPSGGVSTAGFDNNIQVAVRYIAAWLGGDGAVPIYNLMEDAATAEIARSQLWQWLHYPTRLGCGAEVTKDYFSQRLTAIGDEIKHQLEGSPVQRACELLDEIVRDSTLAEFLTLKAYPHIS